MQLLPAMNMVSLADKVGLNYRLPTNDVAAQRRGPRMSMGTPLRLSWSMDKTSSSCGNNAAHPHAPACLPPVFMAAAWWYARHCYCQAQNAMAGTYACAGLLSVLARHVRPLGLV